MLFGGHRHLLQGGGNLVGGLRLLLTDAGQLFGLGAGFVGSHDQLGQIIAGGFDFSGAALHLFHGFVHIARSLLHHFANLGHGGVDFFGGLTGALGQLAHFIGHHGKTTALLTGTGRFDGGVQGQQIGLVGDFANHRRHTADIVHLLAERLHGDAAALDHVHGAGAGGAATVDALTAVQHRFADQVGAVARLFGAVGNAGGRLRDGFHGLRHLLHALRLFVRAGGLGGHALAQVLRVGLRVARRGQHIGHQRAQADAGGLDTDQRLAQAASGLLAHAHRLGEIALADAHQTTAQGADRHAKRLRQRPAHHQTKGGASASQHPAQGGLAIRQQGDQQHQTGGAPVGAAQLFAQRQAVAAGAFGGGRQGAAFVAHIAVQGLGGGDIFAFGGIAHRHIANGFAVFRDRRDIRLHPVEIPCFIAVLDQATPGTAGLQRGPQVGKCLGRHIGMADNIMADANQFVFCKAADVDKSAVGVGDLPLEVSLGHDRPRRIEKDFVLGDWQIDFHTCLLIAALGQGCC